MFQKLFFDWQVILLITCKYGNNFISKNTILGSKFLVEHTLNKKGFAVIANI